MNEHIDTGFKLPYRSNINLYNRVIYITRIADKSNRIIICKTVYLCF